jgi:hypothetical protein
MRPDGESALPADSIILKVGEVKGGLKAMNDRMGRMERSLDRGLTEIKNEVRSVSAAIAATAAPLDDRITALELKDSERKGERGAWLGLSSLLGGIVVAGGQWLVDHLAK